jgi:PilZ domain
MAAVPVVLNIADSAMDARDRRRFRRYPLDTNLTYRLRSAEAPKTIFSGRTLNMSRNGLLFIDHRPTDVLEVGTRLELQVDWPVDSVVLPGRVACLSGTVVRRQANSVAVAIVRFTFREQSSRNRESEDHRKFSTSQMSLPARST